MDETFDAAVWRDVLRADNWELAEHVGVSAAVIARWKGMRRPSPEIFRVLKIALDEMSE